MALNIVTSDVIVATFTYLLFKNNFVSMIDIKNELRTMGYNAKISEIDEVCGLHFDWVAEQEAVFEKRDGVDFCLAYMLENDKRIYSLVDIDNIELSEDDNECSCDSCNCKTDKNKKNDKNNNKSNVIDIIKSLLDKNIIDCNEISRKLKKKGLDVHPRSVAAFKANITRKN